MKEPFFSVIVPVYRVSEQFLKECVGSILAQTFRDFELILVDDGSPDNCGEICDRFAQTDARIRVIHQENQGVSAARNNAIQAATGKWILFIDSDDWIETDTCQILYDQLAESQCEIVMFHAIRETASGSLAMDYGLKENYIYDFSDPKTREFFYCRVMGVSIGNKYVFPIYYSCDKAYRRSFLVDNNLRYPIGLAKSEDKVFISKCLEKLTRFYCISNALYHYRMNEESVCHRYSENMDKHRTELTKVLVPIAKRMDKELALLFGEPGYHKVYDECMRFVFGIITDVMQLKFFHKDNPNRRAGRKMAKQFLKTEPFATAVKYVPYCKLSRVSKMKKFMLRLGFVSLFANINNLIRTNK